MTTYQAKKILSQHYGHSNLEMKAAGVLIEAGLLTKKNETPFMKMLASQMDYHRNLAAKGVR